MPLPPAESTAIDQEVPPQEVSDMAIDAVWYEPGFWIGPTPWDAGVELGMNGATGNSESFSMQVGANAKRETDEDSLAVDLLYAKSSADSVETQNNAYLKGRYDHNVGDSPWTLFGVGTLTYDEFRAFDLRLAANGGVGYDLVRTDEVTVRGRFGGGASREFGGPEDQTVPEAVYGADYEHELTKRQKLRIQADYYPSWENYNDYRLVTDASWEILLDEETNLHLKISLIDRYDSTPNGSKPNDLNYAVLLLWKL